MLEVGKPNVVDDLLMGVPKPDTKTPDAEVETPSAEEVLAKELKANIDYLMIAWKKGDKKRVMFKVGQVARQFVELGRICASFPKTPINTKGIIT